MKSVGPEARDMVAHYHASQLRRDTWKKLHHYLRRLGPGHEGDAAPDGLDARIVEAFGVLRHIEAYWAFPGRRAFEEMEAMFAARNYLALARRVERVERLLASDAYRSGRGAALLHNDEPIRALEDRDEDAPPGSGTGRHGRPYFEVLFVGEVTRDEEDELRSRLHASRRPEDEFVHDCVFVPTFEDALIAVLFNYNIQACILRYSFPFRSSNPMELLQGWLRGIGDRVGDGLLESHIGLVLGETIKSVRPELDLYLVTDAPVEDVAAHLGKSFRRTFYRQEDYLELHLSILKGIWERYETPFFQALRTYSQKPTGVFHALPISRGKSISKSHWIREMADFYGPNIFLAETSATGGGLDSLLQPHGPLKRAQEAASRAFGSRHTYFVTNGTSTANKIVSQALLRPDDVVLVSRDCHKSHHYAVILAGALPDYVDAYPLSQYSMYGAIPLESMKTHLLDLEKAGRLDRVRMIMLTNCTFDGLVYDPARVMEELLAIKPDLVFLWDEAWFAFARFLPVYRRRTAMESARRLRARYRSAAYGEEYAKAKAAADASGERCALPNPDRVRVRVYATQSTHKTLTSLRQGSMIHIHDQDFGTGVADAFQEAYMTHTSTSPNYHILASLDLGRRQVELEGYELVKRSVELAMILRARISGSPGLRRYFRVLGAKDMIPGAYRPSGFEYYFREEDGWTGMDDAWGRDEFVMDPTRITIEIGRTGMDGDTFKRLLIEKYDIQINKTSRNTVLFMVHIGVTRGTLAHLISVLNRIAEDLDETREQMSRVEHEVFDAKVASLTENLPPLPNFSRFHEFFRGKGGGVSAEGDMRRAFFLSYDEDNCRYLHIDGSVQRAMDAGEDVVSASFVTPYPPGFPVLVPGQVVSKEILNYLRALDVKEIHGYNADHGLRVFRPEVLALPETPVAPRPALSARRKESSK